jgi:membrane protein DedA with SNARE-associated domain
MIANGVTNIPSSQVLYLICGYFIANGTLSAVPVIVSGSIGNTVGNAIAFGLTKAYGVSFARKLLLVDEKTFAEIHKILSETFSKKGIWFVFVGKLTPSVKAFIPIIAGLAHTQTVLTNVLFFVASVIWAIAITSIGYFFGEHVSLSTFTGISLAIGGSILLFAYFSIHKKLKQKKN